MAKGKGFPHCSFVSDDGAVTGSSEGMVTTKRYDLSIGKKKQCPDGETKPYFNIATKQYYCRTIEINIDPAYSADKEHQKQLFFWEK